jgi:hypothetical protein
VSDIKEKVSCLLSLERTKIKTRETSSEKRPALLSSPLIQSQFSSVHNKCLATVSRALSYSLVGYFLLVKCTAEMFT